MPEANYNPGNNTIKVRLDTDILRDLIYGDETIAESRDDKTRLLREKDCSLREIQVYRLFKNLVSELNGKLKGRRERFKLVEEGDGLILEYDV
jgi:hypothetical protein